MYLCLEGLLMIVFLMKLRGSEYSMFTWWISLGLKKPEDV